MARPSRLFPLLALSLLLGCPTVDDDDTSDDDDVTVDDDDTSDDDDVTVDDDDTSDDDDVTVDDDDSSDDDDATPAIDADGDGSPQDEDCDDGDPANFPGNVEVCDAQDNDCDGQVDVDAADASTWYADIDGDGHAGSVVVELACEAPPGYLADADDCDDTDASVFPGAPELCDGLDNDCDGALSAEELDGDADGVSACDGDCDDADAAVSPTAVELCNSVDDDCDGEVDVGAADAATWYADLDGDGAGGAVVTAVACIAPDGYLATGDDCDDLEGTTHPGAVELCDGLDNDCDGTVPPDEVDGDSDGLSECAGDCDDGNADVSPLAAELCNSVDDNCDGLVDFAATDAPTWFADLDGDGHGGSVVTTAACSPPPGHVESSDDCDDLDADTWPGGPELCDGADNDCDGTVPSDELDADADGQAECAGDCDDTDPANFEGNTEVCDGADNDCDGVVPTDEFDLDLDGQAECAGDCDDLDPATFAGAPELCDGVDNDCDGVVPTDELDLDLDGQFACEGDCDDLDPATFDGAPEVCDGADNDCDTTIDEGLLGRSAGCAGIDCDDIREASVATAPDGAYWIDPDGVGPVEVYCDMTTDGGGWTLVMKQASNSGYGSPLSVGTWSGWALPGQVMNETDVTLDDANVVSAAYSRLPITELRMTASQTWLDTGSGAWTIASSGTPFDMLSDTNANVVGNLGGAENAPWSSASFTDPSWTSTTTGSALCWRSGPWFNQTSFEYTDGGIKWGWFFNNECEQFTTDTGEGLGCCGNGSWYRESPWTLYVWGR